MSVRTEKVSQNLKRILSMILIKDMNDPVLNMVTITNVKISADLKIAKVYISVYDKSKRSNVLEELSNAKGRIKNRLSSHLRMKFMPDLNFYIDDTIDYVENINSLIREIHKNDKQEDE